MQQAIRPRVDLLKLTVCDISGVLETTLDFSFFPNMRKSLKGNEPISATNIDPPQSRSGFQPIEKNIAREPAPYPHHPLVAGSIVEANLLFCHLQGTTSK